MRPRRLIAGVMVGLGLAACDPVGGSPPPTGVAQRPSSAVAQAQRRHEYPAPAAAPQRTSRTFAAPLLVVRDFAEAYINWTASTVSGRLRTLAALSIGQARAAMTLAAAETSRDYELLRSGVANSGTVQAVARLAGGGYRYAVVTVEHTTAADSDAYQGLRPAWHVTLATVSHLASGGWVMSGWQPES